MLLRVGRPCHAAAATPAAATTTRTVARFEAYHRVVNGAVALWNHKKSARIRLVTFTIALHCRTHARTPAQAAAAGAHIPSMAARAAATSVRLQAFACCSRAFLMMLRTTLRNVARPAFSSARCAVGVLRARGVGTPRGV